MTDFDILHEQAIKFEKEAFSPETAYQDGAQYSLLDPKMLRFVERVRKLVGKEKFLKQIEARGGDPLCGNWQLQNAIENMSVSLRL